ncbi:hypothetical protein BJ742DRAFT_771093 [Cladochytrium replicatum]|nr:hypothetical protein BJ742DRAFT_771093 [Cladochytrium replicatum]
MRFIPEVGKWHRRAVSDAFDLDDEKRREVIEYGLLNKLVDRAHLCSHSPTSLAKAVSKYTADEQEELGETFGFVAVGASANPVRRERIPYVGEQSIAFIFILIEHKLMEEAQIIASSQRNKHPVRIAHFSGFLGDRFSASADVVRSDPPVDVVIGDYLAGLTVAVPISKLVETVGIEKAAPQIQFVCSGMFLHQLVSELKIIADKKIKVVTNGGAFIPVGSHLQLRRKLKHESYLSRSREVSSLDEGTRVDDYITWRIVAANANLGGWGISEALSNGADIIVTIWVVDASLATGPAAWWHGWRNDEWSKLAEPSAILGFPIAEVAHGGSCVITKCSNGAGIVTVDIVTAQFMYETQAPTYLNPDVILHIGTVRMEQIGQDRVKVHSAQGSPPPVTTKLDTLS